MFKPTLTTLKNATRRITGYRAELFGLLNADGATKAEATSALRTHVIDSLHRLDRGTLVHQWKGHTIVVAPDTTGWRYWSDTFSRTNYWVAHYETREAALDAALLHVAQNIWHHHVNDELFVEGLSYPVRLLFTGWATWQRDYHHLTEVKRYTDSEARKILGGFLEDTR